MSASPKVSNSSKFHISEFILVRFPGIHTWQYWLSLPLALLYLSAIGANILILITSCQDPALQQPMYHVPLLGILFVLDMGLATTVMPRFQPFSGLSPRSLASLSVLLKFMPFTALLAWSLVSSSAWLLIDTQLFVTLFTIHQLSPIPNLQICLVHGASEWLACHSSTCACCPA